MCTVPDVSHNKMYSMNIFYADPLSLLVDNALVASWVRQGLPSDPTSVQNGTILTNSERWPLMMDPQLQGVVWIKERESKNNLQVGDCLLTSAPAHTVCCSTHSTAHTATYYSCSQGSETLFGVHTALFVLPFATGDPNGC